MESILRLLEENAKTMLGRTNRAAGLQTAGAIAYIDGRQVQLPLDAYIKRRVCTGVCAGPAECPETQIYMIQRGESYIWLTIPSGLTLDEIIAVGEEEAFDFLREALK